MNQRYRANKYQASLKEKTEAELVLAVKKGQSDKYAALDELAKRGWKPTQISRAIREGMTAVFA